MKNLNFIFEICAGIGLFLFAMYLVEDSLKNLSGRGFKRFLQRITKNNVGAITGGAVVTAVLQSSSMVSLMVLAFVGAGVFTMRNALAIILGANLGTTIDSWLVATLGFKVDIEVVAFPAVFVGGLLLVIGSKRKKLQNIAFLLFGVGLLFIGLSLMKSSMETYLVDFDFSRFNGMPLVVFLAIGFIITLLIQSSSVTMALTLSALHVGAIDFIPAAAIVLGSETGTTIKLLLGAIGGSVVKKRVALGNLLFNLFLTIAAFIFLKSIVLLITNVFGIQDPLIGLVTFSTLINLSALIIFLPFLNPFANFLESRFLNHDENLVAFIQNANVAEPETSMDLFRKETGYFLHNCILFNMEQFGCDRSLIRINPEYDILNQKRKYSEKTLEEKYEFLKQIQGRMQAFYIAFVKSTGINNDEQMSRLISSVRSSIHSVKSMKDIERNVHDLSRSSKNIKYELYAEVKVELESFFLQLNDLLLNNQPDCYDQLHLMYDSVLMNYSSALSEFYLKAQSAPLDDQDITTVINFNRELFTSNKAMLMAVKDFLLEESEAEKFNEIPEYKT